MATAQSARPKSYGGKMNLLVHPSNAFIIPSVPTAVSVAFITLVPIAQTRWTNKFIFPPYDFGLADCAVANFYHPESTLMMSTAAFGGYELVYEAYKMAVKNGYMFGCYGDSLLILPD